MNNEFLKMQKLAGLITENQMKEVIGDIDDAPSRDGDFNPNADAEADNAHYVYNDEGASFEFLKDTLDGIYQAGKYGDKIDIMKLAKNIKDYFQK